MFSKATHRGCCTVRGTILRTNKDSLMFSKATHRRCCTVRGTILRTNQDSLMFSKATHRGCCTVRGTILRTNNDSLMFSKATHRRCCTVRGTILRTNQDFTLEKYVVVVIKLEHVEGCIVALPKTNSSRACKASRGYVSVRRTSVEKRLIR